MWEDDARRTTGNTTTITLERLAALLRAEDKLSRLESAGVDNWEGFDDAMDPDDEDDEEPVSEPYYLFCERVAAAVEDGTLTPDFL